MKIKIVLLILFAIIVACEKDNNNPSYIGTWEHIEENDTLQTNPFLLVLESKMLLTLNKETWQMMMRVKMPPVIDDFDDYMGFKGTMTVDGEDVEIVFKELGYREFNYQTFAFIDDEVVWYSSEDNPAAFEDLFDEYGPESTNISGKMIVEGNKLTMKMDEDMNGQFDEDEITEFTRI